MNGCVVESPDTGRLVSWQQTALRRGLGDAPDPEPPASLAADAVRLAGRVRRWHRVSVLLVLALVAGLCLAIAQVKPPSARHDATPPPTVAQDWLTYGSLALWSPEVTVENGAGPHWCVGLAPKHRGLQPTPIHCEPLPTGMTGPSGDVWSPRTPPPDQLPQPVVTDETDHFAGHATRHRLMVVLVPYNVAYLTVTGRYTGDHAPFVPPYRAKLGALPNTAAIPFLVDVTEIRPSAITVHPATGKPYPLRCAVCAKPSAHDVSRNIG